jgi:uncharacterized membrane protein YphA (DoxX/SURF4 family)
MIPTDNGIRFLTWYDYRTRFGTAGALFDRVIFRPLIGWATAWSFDRLRLWLEQDVNPAQALRQTLVHSVARVALAAIFAYQGLVPKLIARHADEIAMLRDAGLSVTASDTALDAVGIVELALAVALIVSWHRRWPAWVCLASMVVATAAVGLHSPRFFEAAFNPFSLNVAVASLSAIDVLVVEGIPSAARCRRRPSTEQV